MPSSDVGNAQKRLKFIRCLATSSPEQIASSLPTPSAKSRPSSNAIPAESSKRKKFISILGGEGQIVPSDPSQKDPDLEQDQSKRRVAVDFTMEGLLDFKNTCQAVSMGRPADESRGKLRKRPNYNGAMRKHLAKLQDRVP